MEGRGGGGRKGGEGLDRREKDGHGEGGCVNPAPTQRFNAGFLPGKNGLSSFECFSPFFLFFIVSFLFFWEDPRKKEKERGVATFV